MYQAEQLIGPHVLGDISSSFFISSCPAFPTETVTVRRRIRITIEILFAI
jgi:hypothetical protein